MSPVPQYMRWLSVLCAVMASFGVGVLVIGYKTPSVGRIMTIMCLYVVASILFYAARRMAHKNSVFASSLSSAAINDGAHNTSSTSSSSTNSHDASMQQS